MLEGRAGERPPVSLYVKGLLSGWVTGTAFFMLIAVAQGYSPRKALLPVVVIAAIFTPMIIVPIVSKLGPAQGTARLRPTAVLRLGGSYEDAFDRCVEAVASLENSTVLRADGSKGLIVARVKASWESFGEIVRLQVSREAAGAAVRLSSRPRMPLTVLDQGKNERNLQAIVDRLTELPASPSLGKWAPGGEQRVPSRALAIGGASLILHLIFQIAAKGTGAGYVWFALANVGSLLAFFGAGLYVARSAGASKRIEALVVTGAVLSLIGQFVVLAR